MRYTYTIILTVSHKAALFSIKIIVKTAFLKVFLLGSKNAVQLNNKIRPEQKGNLISNDWTKMRIYVRVGHKLISELSCYSQIDRHTAPRLPVFIMPSGKAQLPGLVAFLQRGVML